MCKLSENSSFSVLYSGENLSLVKFTELLILNDKMKPRSFPLQVLYSTSTYCVIHRVKGPVGIYIVLWEKQ